ncbi:hypothetical protein [Streptomyces sp. NPDC091219]|uniref:hypothetical protein n=1 Tax=Streptomyces sp. NPDC091219 TaxID=3155193 RepID=UPI0034509BD6
MPGTASRAGLVHDVLRVAGLAGAVLCLAGHLSSPPRQWLPHAVVTVVMLAMLPGATGPDGLSAGAVVLGAVCVWQWRVGCSYRRSAESVNLAAMAMLSAVAVGSENTHHDGSGSVSASVSVAEGAATAWAVLVLVGCWGLARIGAVLVSRAWPALPTGPRPARQALLAAESGGALMIGTMAVMLAWP